MRPPPPHSVGPLPLVIGVTGHIDLVTDEMPALRAAVDAVLGSAREAACHSPVHLLSSLAEGADQLVAQQAVHQGFPLIAVLPMPLPEYVATFSSDDGLTVLKQLWQSATIRCELPWLNPFVRDPKPQYEQAGLVVSRFSHLMLALWNGLDPYDPTATDDVRQAQQGGTAHIVHLRTHGESNSDIFALSPIFPNVASLLDPADSGPTLRIATPRTKFPGCRGATGSLWLRTNGDADDVEVRDIAQLVSHQFVEETDDGDEQNTTAAVLLRRLDRANLILSQAAAWPAGPREKASDEVLPSSCLATLGEEEKAVRDLRNAYALADQVSMHYRMHTDWAIGLLVSALLLAVVSFEIYAHALRSAWVIGGYLFVILGSLIYYQFLLKPRRYQSQYQDFRALAEALRVQLFWALACVPSAVSDYYLRKHRNEMSWISHALRGPGLAAVTVALKMKSCRRDLVEEHWIAAQLHYFAGDTSISSSAGGKAALHWRRHHRCKQWANRFYIFGVVVAFLVCLGQIATSRNWVNLLSISEELRDWLFGAGVILMGLAPAVSAALTIYSEMHAAKDHAHQYSRMAQVFKRAAKVLRDVEAQRQERFADVVRDLGIEALAENGDWLLAHRDRRVEPIKGG